MTPPKPARKPRSTPLKAPEDRHFVAALARGLEVLSSFRSGDGALANQEIAQRCRLPRSTVSRLTFTLTKLGYLQLEPDSGKYRLGTATLGLGSAMLARMDVRALARPRMQALADESRAMVSLATRDRLSMIYVENCRSASALTLSLDIGSRIPVATTAIGRAWLAAASDAERSEVMSRQQELDEFSWPQAERGIARALDDYHRLGVACSFGDWQKDVNAIARAVRQGPGKPPLAINCGGPSFNTPREFLLDVVRPRLIALTDEIEAALQR